MTGGKLLLAPGTLWARVAASTEHALRGGALQPIPTESEFVEQNGIRFLIRVMANLARKDQSKNQQDGSSGKAPDPFLPYEPDLFVADISDTHLCLLNKFNVLQHHLLIVTRAFEDQQNPLSLPDFEALWACLGEFDSLGFYNAGRTAGASQRHKHLQLVPLPFVPAGPRIPIEAALVRARFQGSLGTTPALSFLHAMARLDLDRPRSPREAAEIMLENYRILRQALGLQEDSAYNLLATRQWMLLIPRSRERFDSISVNALGFAGALLVRNEQQLKTLKDYGPMTILKSVAY